MPALIAMGDLCLWLALAAWLQVTAVADVYNDGCMGWEPVVEPWTVEATLESSSLCGISGPPHHEARVTAGKGLELTASLATADAAAACLLAFAGPHYVISLGFDHERYRENGCVRGGMVHARNSTCLLLSHLHKC